MRTAIFLGLTAIADAIRKDWVTGESSVIAFCAIALLCMIIMDITEFIKTISKKN